MKNIFLILFISFLSQTQSQAALKLTNGKTNGNFLYESDGKALASNIQIAFKSGSINDPKGKEGLAKIAFEALLRGTKTKSRIDFSTMLERLGAQIEVNTGSNRTIISLETVSENMEKAIALLAEAINEPALREQDIKSLIDESLAKLNQEKSNNRSTLKRAVRLALYEKSSLAIPAEGTIEGVRSLTQSDISNFLSANIKSGNIVIASTSNHPEARVKEWVEKYFEKIPNGDAQTQPLLKTDNPKGRTVFLVNRKGSSTTEMGIAQMGIAANDKNRLALETGLFIFGADFTSRIPTVLRKENGWTYGAYASLNMLDKPRNFGGTFMIYAFPQTQFTDKATLKALEMYEAYVKDGITNKELLFAQKSLANSYPFEFATSKARLMARLYERLDGAPVLTTEEYKKEIYALTPKKILGAIQKIHDPKNLAIVLVGEPEKIQALAKQIPGVASIKEMEDPMRGLQ